MARVLLACTPEGFGPVSKLTAIANCLDVHERIFVGMGGAYDFAQQHAASYERIFASVEFWDGTSADRACDFAIVVMDADATFRSAQAGIPVFLFDSLIETWRLPNDINPIATAANDMTRLGHDKASSLFYSFTAHERQMLAHMLATHSFAQNFPGVPARISELRRKGMKEIGLVGSIIDVPVQYEARSQFHSWRSWTMLINLGGVQCSGIEFGKNDYAVKLIERWAEGFLRTNTTCCEIQICCAKYKVPDVTAIGGGKMIRRCAAHDEFILEMMKADIVLTTAGRTTLHEAASIGKVPVLLPEQHHNQRCNAQALRALGFKKLILSLDEVDGELTHTDDEIEGTAALVERTRMILNTAARFDKFDKLLRDRIRTFRCLSAEASKELVFNLREAFDGPNFVEVVKGLAKFSG
jgi:hypothetical protein